MPEEIRVLFGAGRMGAALAAGWLAEPGHAVPALVDPKPSDQVQAWADAGRVHLNPPAQPATTLVIAVKPQVFGNVASEIGAWIGPKTRVISIMAGLRLAQLSQRLGTDRVVRAMPNTPGAIGQGVVGLSPGDGVSQADLAAARRVLEPLGLVEGPMSEANLAVLTAVSGSGPAYVFLLAEAMAIAGKAEGLPDDVAERIARATVVGAGALLAQSEEAPLALRQAVTSPGGVTEAALDVLIDEGGLPSLMRKAVKAGIARDRALSGGGG